MRMLGALMMLAVGAPAAHGAILTYYLHDARIGDTFATGAFAFDDVFKVPTLPEVRIDPVAIPALGYLFFPTFGDSSLLVAPDPRFQALIHIAFAVPLGGSVAPFNLADSYVRLEPTGRLPQLYFTSGFASTTSIPEPATWLIALLGIAVLLRRRS